MKLLSKIFMDGGSPSETKQANESFHEHFGYSLDGQTTNPSLIAKSLKASLGDNPLTESVAIDAYKEIVTKINQLLPNGSVSIQVFANEDTSPDEILSQARARSLWIPNASIKIPCTKSGLEAASIACKEMPLNITLVFSQEQAAGVYESTKDAKFPIFLSPFVGRLDDIGENGMDIIKNILKLYKEGDNHVEVLTASVRSVEHILYALYLKSPIITLPYKTFLLWKDAGFPVPDSNYAYQPTGLKEIAFNENISLGKDWKSYNLSHPLTSKGIQNFWSDWTSLISDK